MPPNNHPRPKKNEDDTVSAFSLTAKINRHFRHVMLPRWCAGGCEDRALCSSVACNTGRSGAFRESTYHHAVRSLEPILSSRLDSSGDDCIARYFLETLRRNKAFPGVGPLGSSLHESRSTTAAVHRD